MVRFTIKKLAGLLAVIFVVSIVVFFLGRGVAPGDAGTVIIGTDGATPEQEAADAVQMNAFAKQLIVLFGVQKALHDALLRMQSDPIETFYTPEYWAVGQPWVEATFFAEVLPSETPAS